MTLFLDGIFNTDMVNTLPPSAIRIYFPVAKEGGEGVDHYEKLQGLLTSEVTVSSQIKWGTILNDFSSLQSVASLLGEAKMWTWIGASTLCWQGTEPVKTSIDFYLINYKRGLRLNQKLTELNMLTAMVGAAGNSSSRVLVHGGYSSKVLQTNRQLLANGEGGEKEGSKKEEENKDYGFLDTVFASLERVGQLRKDQLEEGTVKIIIGNKLFLSQMLVQRLDVTPSIVEVEGGLPLYYRVSMSLTGTRPLVSSIVDNMYR